MNNLGPWTIDDYDSMSWHDVHVYGLRLDACDDADGCADLVLDVDYILKWGKAEEGFLFTVCQAALRFHNVFRLRLSLDYVTPTAGMCPFSIDGIERERLELPSGYKSYRWRLPVNWPIGEIEFESPGFTQTLIGSPQVQAEQVVPAYKRRMEHGA